VLGGAWVSCVVSKYRSYKSRRARMGSVVWVVMNERMNEGVVVDVVGWSGSAVVRGVRARVPIGCFGNHRACWSTPFLMSSVG